MTGLWKIIGDWFLFFGLGILFGLYPAWLFLFGIGYPITYDKDSVPNWVFSLTRVDRKTGSINTRPWGLRSGLLLVRIFAFGLISLIVLGAHYMVWIDWQKQRTTPVQIALFESSFPVGLVGIFVVPSHFLKRYFKRLSLRAKRRP